MLRALDSFENARAKQSVYGLFKASALGDEQIERVVEEFRQRLLELRADLLRISEVEGRSPQHLMFCVGATLDPREAPAGHPL